MGTHLVVKTRLKHLISDKVLVARIHDAVHRANDIVQRGYFLLKAHTLRLLDEQINEAGGFTHAVAGAVSQTALCDNVFALVLTSVSAAHSQGRPHEQKAKDVLAQMEQTREELEGQGALPSTKPSRINLPFALGYSATEMETAYKNNVHMHFPKYVAAVARKVLEDAEVAAHGAENWRLVPSAAKKVVSRNVAVLRDAVLFGDDTNAYQGPVPEALLEELRQLAPPLDFQEAQDAPGRRGTRNYHLKAHWRAYVPYMAVVNRRLESLGVKMYCPFPLRPSFVPRSIHLDSQGLLDVLVQSNDQALLLKGIVEEDFGQGLPGVRGKNDFNKSVTKLVAPGEQVVGSSAPGRLRTCVWRGLTKIGRHRHLPLEYKGLCFNNMITTDGYSVSAHYVPAEKVGATRYNNDKDGASSSKQRKQAVKDPCKPGFPKLTKAAASELLDPARTRVLSADPGKGVLLEVVEAVHDHDGRPRKYNALRYTAKQRRFESSQTRNNKEALKVCNRGPPGQELSYKALATSLGEDNCSHKSCTHTCYVGYLKRRYGQAAAPLEALYQATIFRRHKFRAWSGRKSSEDKFINALLKRFNTDSRRLVIMYGDWGRNPNIRHSPPTPGIGLRRRIHKRVPTISTPERNTSSVCFDCGQRSLREQERRDSEGRLLREVHQLLRCTNAQCCRWWTRDVLGALNIGKQGLHFLRHGCMHPCFTQQPGG